MDQNHRQKMVEATKQFLQMQRAKFTSQLWEMIIMKHTFRGCISRKKGKTP